MAKLPFLPCAKIATVAEKKRERVCSNLKLGRYRKRKAGQIIQVYKQVQEMNENIILAVEERKSGEMLTNKKLYVNPE